MAGERKQIEIDVDVYKALESERETFKETHNDILRRILGVSSSPGGEEQAASKRRDASIAWRRNGVELPEGTRWRLVTTGPGRSGHVSAGYFDYQGAKFKSPSGLAMHLYRTKTGKTTNLNGWRYIEICPPHASEWTLLHNLLRPAKVPNRKPRG